MYVYMYIYTYTHFSAHTQTHLHAPHAHTHSSTHTLSPAHPPAPTLVKFLNCFFLNPPNLKGFRFSSQGSLSLPPPPPRLPPLSFSLFQVCDGYSGVFQTGRRIIREEGPWVFSKGLGARVVWVCVFVVFLFTARCVFVSLSLSW